MEKESLYVDIQIPFCPGRCVICDQVTFGQNIAWIHRYMRALEKEIAGAAEELADYNIAAVHIHNDALSLLGVGAVDNFLGKLRKLLPVNEQTEWIVELMPQELTDEFCHTLFARNHVNKVILKLMGMTKAELTVLHTPFTVNVIEHGLNYAGEHSLPGLCIQLGFGFPDQSDGQLTQNLQKIAALSPEQISLIRYHNNRLSPAEQRAYAEETDWFGLAKAAQQVLLPAGYLREGKSLHFAKEGKLHADCSLAANQGNHMGFGIGAVTQMDGFDYHNTKDMNLYLEHSDEPEMIAVL